jgi:signal recognition particle subunit SRP54
MGNVPEEVKGQLSDKEFIRTEAIINSMTVEERRSPGIIKGSRKRRIAAGSGTQVQDVNRLLKQFEQMQRMMKSLSKGGLGRLMKGLGGKFPGRMPF